MVTKQITIMQSPIITREGPSSTTGLAAIVVFSLFLTIVLID